MTAAADTVAAAVNDLGVTRLVHFTPAKNLPHILRDGLRSSSDLAANSPGYFDPTDVQRFDEHPEHVCTSFQFPNTYYLKRARNKPDFQHFPDWACILLDPALAEQPDTLFSECNAATDRGAWLTPGPAALRDCFGPVVGRRRIGRATHHHRGAATDLQAEALLHGTLTLTAVTGIVLPTEYAVVEELGRLQLLGRDISRLPAPLYFQPLWFDADRLPAAVRAGRDVEPTLWSPTPPSTTPPSTP